MLRSQGTRAEALNSGPNAVMNSGKRSTQRGATSCSSLTEYASWRGVDSKALSHRS